MCPPEWSVSSTVGPQEVHRATGRRCSGGLAVGRVVAPERYWRGVTPRRTYWCGVTAHQYLTGRGRAGGATAGHSLPSMHPSEAQARVLVAELVAQGVRDVVLCPGSRSAPLAFALHALDAAGSVRLHVRIDERSGAFTAVGLAKASGRPTAVVTTSGTATANLHPAVLEAHHSGVPLVVLTADRPPELRGVGANQATDQMNLFGPAVRLFHEVGVARRELGQVGYWRDVAVRAAAAATGALSRDPGPVHLNLAFAEPLTPDGIDDWPEPLDGSGSREVPPVDVGMGYLSPARATVVVAGDGAGYAARSLAEVGGWPLLAEPSSGARHGANSIPAYRLLLEIEGLGTAIERVVTFGRCTLSRPVTRLLARTDVELIVVSRRPDWADPARRASLVLPAVRLFPGSTRDETDWLARWQTAGSLARSAIGRFLDAEARLTGVGVAATVDSALPEDAQLVVGSSNSIRDLDLVAQTGRPVRANRGLSGIDGTVSTAVGAALGIPGRPTYALIGDLTFLHDINGLLVGSSEPQPDLTIVVSNDGGGGIFHTLEPGAPEHAQVFERAFGTPHTVDIAALCSAYGARYVRADNVESLAAAVAQRPAGITVVEVPIDRSGVRDLHARLAAAVTRAVEVRGLAT